jgi:hypothetical protein
MEYKYLMKRMIGYTLSGGFRHNIKAFFGKNATFFWKLPADIANYVE